MRPPKTEQSGNYVQAVADSSSYQLGLGQPSPRLLPIEPMRQASQEFFAQADPMLLQYNRGAGAQSLRASIAAMLTRHRNRAINPDSLIVSAGNSQALAWVASTLSAPGDVMVCENPTYFLAAKIFEDAGLSIQAVPVGSQGLCVTTLQRELQAGLRPKWVYSIPTHHNPTGVNLSAEHLQALLALAERYDFLVVFDDPYAQLHFDASSPNVLDALLPETQGPWLRLGSFSKIFAPGVRLGWVEASPGIQAKLLAKGMMRSGGGLNPISGAMIQAALDNGSLERHRDNVRSVLAQRAKALQTAVAEHLPQVSLWPVSGGYFGWIEWNAPFDTRAFARFSRTRGVNVLAGELCCVRKEAPWIHGARVSLSFYEAEELTQALVGLAQNLCDFDAS